MLYIGYRYSDDTNSVKVSGVSNDNITLIFGDDGSLRYDDIINLPHHISPTRQRMSMHDRAAQFAPFAALVGYDDAVAETARLTETRPELDEQEQKSINERLAYIADHIKEQPDVRIQYFVLDEHKSGGAFVEVSGKVKKISATDGTIVLTDGCKKRLSDIIDLSI